MHWACMEAMLLQSEEVINGPESVVVLFDSSLLGIDIYLIDPSLFIGNF